MLQGLFPCLLTEYWQDHDSLSEVALSIWDHWLVQSGSQHLLANATKSEEDDWNGRIAVLSTRIVERTDVYLLKFWKHRRLPSLKEVRSVPSAIRRLTSGDYAKFDLVLPEFEAVYSIGDDFTLFFRCQSLSKAATLIQWAEEAGLRVVGECA